MERDDAKRFTRLIEIFLLLQSKRIVTGTNLANRLNVSVRTIYRDIKALEQAGVPIYTEEGKGYSIVEGYRIPPIMFTEMEANALITAEQFVLKDTDSSLIKSYTDAVNKIKAVLAYTLKEKTELLSDRVRVKPYIPHEYISSSLATFQNAIVHSLVTQIVYRSETKNEVTTRDIEPFALYINVNNSWTLIAKCRLREDFRQFRLERIQSAKLLDEKFEPLNMTLEQWIDDYKKKNNRGN